MEVITENYVKNLLARRPKDMNKGGAGRVLIAAGSPGMAGAAVLAARTTLKSGAGLVQVAIDEALWPIIQVGEPCATCVGRSISFDLYDAVVIGPGIGKGDAGIAITTRALREYKGKLIIDADALNIIAAIGSDFTSASGEIVITPHPGEAARLLGIDVPIVNASREDTARRLAQLSGGTAVLKGYESLVFSASSGMTLKAGIPAVDDRVYLNPTGNPGMATAGSGDVLTGIIAAFAGMGLCAADAAKAGVYVHGVAGDIAAAKIGEYGVTATDISEAVPAAIRSLTDSREFPFPFKSAPHG
jgi:NAD(P)H-hydrate epimerase